MEVQHALGSDIVMVFDERPEAAADEARRSMELTARWAKRSRQAFDNCNTLRHLVNC